MRDRPTPETDAAWQADKDTVFRVETSRKLERERDEAIIKYTGQANEFEKQRNIALAKLEEAREELKHIEEYGTEEINSAIELRQKLAQALVDLDNMQDQRDLAMKVIKRLERERAEAREQAQRLRVQLNHYTQANEMAEQAFRERNKAYKIAEQAIEDLAWFNETNAQRLGNELEQLKEETK
jgi:chromosome segregation ATPase